MDNVRLGIIGAGNMGSAHARSILEGKVPGLTLTALCDADPARLEAWREHSLATFTSHEELLAANCVDAVLIATPHYDHTTIGIQALEAGLHVLVEKPIGVHKADCQRLIEAHTNKNQIFAAMFNQRTDVKYRWLRERLQNGELGTVRRVNWIITNWFRTEIYYRSGGWRATWAGEGGGVLLNQCPHQIDLWHWLFGMPKTVRAFCKIGQFHDIEVEDNVTAYMEYENGCTGVFLTTTGEAPGANRLEVVGDLGTVVIEQGSVTWQKADCSVADFSRGASEPFAKPDFTRLEPEIEGQGEQHVGILKNFTGAILRGEELLAPACEGIYSVELANAMLYSGARNDTIEMPLDAAAYEALLQDRIKRSTFVKETADAGVSADMSSSF